MRNERVTGRFAVLAMCAQLAACAPAPIEDAAPDHGPGFDADSADASESSVALDGVDVGPPRDIHFAPFDSVPADIVGAFGACNTLRTTALPIEEARVRGDVPSPHGGTIVNGWYVLTAAVIYTT